MLHHSLFLSLCPRVPYSGPLLQTCSTAKIVYDHAWLSVYVYLWVYLPHMKKTEDFCGFDPGLLH
jgi:hypothetical protein